jgi:hypothetical protein
MQFLRTDLCREREPGAVGIGHGKHRAHPDQRALGAQPAHIDMYSNPPPSQSDRSLYTARRPDRNRGSSCRLPSRLAGNLVPRRQNRRRAA